MVDNENLYKEALELKGELSQIDITIEESAELIQALIKYKRIKEGYDKLIAIDNITEEMVDTLVMIQQMIVTFDVEKRFNEIYKNKIERLRMRLQSLKEEKKCQKSM